MRYGYTCSLDKDVVNIGFVESKKTGGNQIKSTIHVWVEEKGEFFFFVGEKEKSVVETKGCTNANTKDVVIC